MAAKRAIVIGASSGIGRALVKELVKDGYEVGAVARRLDLLQALKKECPDGARIRIRQMDVAIADEARKILTEMIEETGGIDLLVYNSGTGIVDPSPRWAEEVQTIQVNATGFAALLALGFDYFCQKGEGHLVGVSSVAGARGSGQVRAYNATKAFASNYLQGLRQNAVILNRPKVYVTDIRPGFVATPMVEGLKNVFLEVSAEKAAALIMKAIRARKATAYVPGFWRLIAWWIRVMPEWLYNSKANLRIMLQR